MFVIGSEEVFNLLGGDAVVYVLDISVNGSN